MCKHSYNIEKKVMSKAIKKKTDIEFYKQFIWVVLFC